MLRDPLRQQVSQREARPFDDAERGVGPAPTRFVVGQRGQEERPPRQGQELLPQCARGVTAGQRAFRGLEQGCGVGGGIGPRFAGGAAPTVQPGGQLRDGVHQPIRVSGGASQTRR